MWSHEVVDFAIGPVDSAKSRSATSHLDSFLHDCMLNAVLVALGACLYIFNFWENIKNIWFWGFGHCNSFPAVFRQCGHHLGCLDDMQLQNISSHAFLEKPQFLEDGFANDLCSCRCLYTYAQMNPQAYKFVEFFSGDANATWCLKHWGLQGVCFDNSYGGHWNNIFEPSGFACFACSFC